MGEIILVIIPVAYLIIRGSWIMSILQGLEQHRIALKEYEKYSEMRRVQWECEKIEIRKLMKELVDG